MDKHKIIQQHLAGQSNRSIARNLGVNRKTVDKYVADFKFLQNQLIQSEKMSQEEIREPTEAIVKAPQYKPRKSTPRKYTAEMDAFLDEILEAEKRKRELLRTGKQQLTKTQIHELLVEAGFGIGLTTICAKINEKRNKNQEAFIAQTYDHGKRFEYDFGEVHLYIADKFTKINMAVMSTPASGYRYAILYSTQKFDVFVDSQVRFFEHLGGCFKEGVYDNMRNVVSKFVGCNEKELNQGLIQLSQYYGFCINTTNCYCANEKGSVENAVKIARNRAFATHYRFDSLKQAQQHLNAALEKLNESSTIEDEKQYLTPYRPPFESADLRAGVLVNKLSCISVDNNFYSVPDILVGKTVLVKNYPNSIVVTHNHRVVASHTKTFGKGEMCLDIKHYLDTFFRKPGALANSSALRAVPDLKIIFDTYYKNNPKKFINILQESRDYTIQELTRLLQPQVSQLDEPDKSTLQDAIALQTLQQITTLGKKACHVC